MNSLDQAPQPTLGIVLMLWSGNLNAITPLFPDMLCMYSCTLIELSLFGTGSQDLKNVQPLLVADANTPINRIDVKNLDLFLDTFDRNIEEQALSKAIKQAGPLLKHFHYSENNRGPIGTSHMPWADVQVALQSAHDQGNFVAESFRHTLPAISRACYIWRLRAVSPYTLAQESASFLHRLWRFENLA